MRPDLLESISRRNGLYLIWAPGHMRSGLDWLLGVAREMSQQGSVVLIDLAHALPISPTAPYCMLDVRFHQGAPDRKDDHTVVWEPGIHLLPTGIHEFPYDLDPLRQRNFLVNLQLIREQFATTLVLLPDDWKPMWLPLVNSASAVIAFPASSFTEQAAEVYKDLPSSARSRWMLEPSSIWPSSEGWAARLLDARQVHVLLQNPPETWKILLQRFWWLLGLALAVLVLLVPLRLDVPDSLFRNLDAEYRLYMGKPFFEYRFNGAETLQRLGKNAIGRFTGLVPAESEIREYLVETSVKNRADTSKWRHDPGGVLIPDSGTTWRFYPPEHLFNPEADSLLPAWRFFTSLLSDSLAYVTEYYNPTGAHGGRVHAGIDIAGKQGSRILAPYSGKAWTTVDERGGVVIALIHEKDVLLFMHCDQLLYMDGQDVFAGDPLATVGMTGHTTGPHVHFAVGRVVASGSKTAGPVHYETTNPIIWVYSRLSK